MATLRTGLVLGTALLAVLVSALGNAPASAQIRGPRTGPAEPASPPPPPTVRSLGTRGNGTLVRTQGPSGIGLAIVPSSVFDGMVTGDRITTDDIEALQTLLRLGRNNDAVNHATRLLAADPGHHQVRRLLALALRRSWSFAASLAVLDDVLGAVETSATTSTTGTTPPPLDLTLHQEHAEVAVLLGVRRIWEPAIRRYKRVARNARSKEHEDRADELSRHGEGRSIEVFAAGPPPHRDQPALAKARTDFDTTKHSHHVAAEAAKLLESFLSEVPGLEPSARLTLTPVDELSAQRYAAGGLESTFRGRIRSARASVTVSRTAWLRLWDHDKHEHLYGLGYILRERFSAADVSAAVYVNVLNDGVEKLRLAASIRIAYGKSPAVELLNDPNWDPRRDEAIKEEMDEAEENWRGRSR